VRKQLHYQFVFYHILDLQSELRVNLRVEEILLSALKGNADIVVLPDVLLDCVLVALIDDRTVESDQFVVVGSFCNQVCVAVQDLGEVVHEGGVVDVVDDVAD